jgi:flagellar basal-body rod protein FlgB
MGCPRDGALLVQGGTERPFEVLPQGDPSPVLFDITQLALERAIEGAGKRHEALAANLANANTPGYQRVDVEFHGALASAMERDEDARTSLATMSFSPARDASAGATRADGSTVDVESESAKLAANALEHQAAVQVAHARIGILKAAMGTGV